jgi:6-phosphogluconate dehydrogenase
MGANMARRLCRGGIEVVGFNRSAEITQQLAREEGLIAALSTAEAIAQLKTPRVLWLMLPSGASTGQMIEELIPQLTRGDIIVDGGNSNYHDSERRGAQLAGHGIGFMDAGTSGGVWGLKNGYCLMVGGSKETAAVLEPVLKVLAPAPDRGWAHIGPVGAGHFTKMIHNGIEYGMMQAFTEGLSLLHGKQEFNLDLAQITELWRHSSVVRSWLLDLTAEALNSKGTQSADQFLEQFSAKVDDSGEGRWAAIEGVDQGIATPVMTLALQMRFASRDSGYGYRLLSLMRNAFGGHASLYKDKKS